MAIPSEKSFLTGLRTRVQKKVTARPAGGRILCFGSGEIHLDKGDYYRLREIAGRRKTTIAKLLT